MKGGVRRRREERLCLSSERSRVLRSMWSFILPGVPTTMSTPERSLFSCGA